MLFSFYVFVLALFCGVRSQLGSKNNSLICELVKNGGDKGQVKYCYNDLFRKLMRMFTVSDRNRHKMIRHFKMESAELIYPANMDIVWKLKRCVIGTRIRKNSESIVIKFELDSTIRARYDRLNRLIVCGHQSSAGRSEEKQFVSAEKYIATKMSNSSNFVKFYPNLSVQFKMNQSLLLNTYVYERLDKSENLLKWTQQQRKKSNMSNLVLESHLKVYFRQVHSALSALLENGLAYTDFKPENVMIRGNRSYLIDLESVVNINSRYVCLYTPLYVPPAYSLEGNLVARNSLHGDFGRRYFHIKSPRLTHDRILAWTFCFSIYSLVCLDQEKSNFRALVASLNDKFAHWQSSEAFVSAFGCNNGRRMTVDLFNFLNKCLIKEQTRPLFQTLTTNNEWLK